MNVPKRLEYHKTNVNQAFPDIEKNIYKLENEHIKEEDRDD